MAEETIIVTGEARLQELRDELETLVKLTERAGEAALKMGSSEAQLSKQIHGLRAKVRLLIAASEKLSKVTKAEVVNAFSASTRGVKEMGKEYEKLFIIQRKLTAALRSETQASAKRNEAGKKGRADARADIDKAEKERAQAAERRQNAREREQKAELRAFKKQAAAQKEATKNAKREAERQEADLKKAATKRNKDIERRIKDEERAAASVANALKKVVASEKKAIASKAKLNRKLKQEGVNAKATERAMRPLIEGLEDLTARATGARKGVDKFGDELRDLKSQMNVAANSGRKLGRVLQNEIRKKSDKAAASVRNLGRRQQKTNAAMSGFAHQIGVVFPKFGLLSQAVTGFNVAAGVAIGVVGLLAYEVGGRLKDAAVEYMKATKHGRAATRKFSDALAQLQLIAGRWLAEATGLEGHMARMTVVMTTQSSIIERQKISMNDLAGAAKKAAKEHSYFELQLEGMAIAIAGPVGLALVGLYEGWRSVTNEVLDSTAAMRTWSRTAKHMKTLAEWQAYREKQRGFKDPGIGYYEAISSKEGLRQYEGQLVDLPGQKGKFRQLQPGERPESPEDIQAFYKKGFTVESLQVATITYKVGGKKHTLDDLAGLSLDEMRLVAAEIKAGRSAALTRKGTFETPSKTVSAPTGGGGFLGRARRGERLGEPLGSDALGVPITRETPYAPPLTAGILEGRVLPGAAEMGLGARATDVVFTPGQAVLTGPRGRERRTGGGGSQSLPQYPDAPRFMGTLGESYDKLLSPLSEFVGTVKELSAEVVKGSPWLEGLDLELQRLREEASSTWRTVELMPGLTSTEIAEILADQEEFNSKLKKLQEERKSISVQFRDLRGLKGKALNKAMLAFSKTAPEAIKGFIDKAPVEVREQLQLFLKQVVDDATETSEKGVVRLKESGKKSLKHWDKFFGNFQSVYKRFIAKAIRAAKKSAGDRATKEREIGSKSVFKGALGAVEDKLQVNSGELQNLTHALTTRAMDIGGLASAKELAAKAKEESRTIPGTPEQRVPIAERLLSVEVGKERAQARKDAMKERVLEVRSLHAQTRVQILRILSSGESSRALTLAHDLPPDDKVWTRSGGRVEFPMGNLATADGTLTALIAYMTMILASAGATGPLLAAHASLGMAAQLPEGFTLETIKERGLVDPKTGQIRTDLKGKDFLDAAGPSFTKVDEFLKDSGMEDINKRAKLIKDKLNLILGEVKLHSIEVFTEQVNYAKEAIMDFGIAGVEAFSQLAGAGALTAETMKKTMLSMIGSLASSWGDYYIALGIAESANPLAPGTGAGMIAAGIALKALGGYLKGYASRSPGQSSGGAGASKSNTARDLLKRDREERETIVEVFVMGDQIRDPIYRVVNEGIRRNVIQMRG